jgi:hypothetical protein
VVGAGHSLRGVDDAENAVLVTADLAGTVMVRGPGAGGDSTASAVVSDIVATVGAPHEPPPVPTATLALGDQRSVERGGYVRVRLRAVADAAQLVLQALDDRGIPVEMSTLFRPAGQDAEHLALLTGPVAREILEHACETLDSLSAVDEVVTVMDCLGAD